MADVDHPVLSADGESLMVQSGPRFGVISPMPGQKIKDPIPTNNLFMNLVAKEEWRQIFTDTWRRYRDFFYDPALHGVDWPKMRERYGALVEDARTRWDVTNICSSMQAELSAGHTYTGGGDVEQVVPVMTGFLVVLLAMTILTSVLHLEVLSWLMRTFFAFFAVAALVSVPLLSMVTARCSLAMERSLVARPGTAGWRVGSPGSPARRARRRSRR